MTEVQELTIAYANQRVLEKFVNHIDLFDKVVSYKPEDPALRNYLIGFEMINNKLKDISIFDGNFVNFKFVQKVVMKYS